MKKTPNSFALLPLIALLVAACASVPDQQNEVNNTDAIDDYIKVAELEEIDAIRSFAQFNHRAISEHYVIIYDKHHSYLVTYKTPCRELRRSTVRPDVRFERTTLRARFDTVRGCKIGELHKISEGQVKEIMLLGQQST